MAYTLGYLNLPHLSFVFKPARYKVTEVYSMRLIFSFSPFWGSYSFFLPPTEVSHFAWTSVSVVVEAIRASLLRFSAASYDRLLLTLSFSLFRWNQYRKQVSPLKETK